MNQTDSNNSTASTADVRLTAAERGGVGEAIASRVSTEDVAPSQGMPDPRPGFGRALQIAASVLAVVDGSNVRRPSPCADFDAGEMAGHLVGVLRRVSVVAKSLDPYSVPIVVEGLEPDGFVKAWADAVAEYESIWSPDEVLGQVMELPFATLPGGIALAIFTSEILTHTWDLASAVGAAVAWDEQVVEGALATMQFGLPAEPRGGEIPFGPVVAVADDAPAIDRLVAWLGRQP